MTRLFVSEDLRNSDNYTLTDDNAHYVGQVLRMRTGESLVIVDGNGLEYVSEVCSIDKKEVSLKLGVAQVNTSEPPYEVTLYQAVSKGERMDLTIQKCVELGVTRIVPVMSNRCIVKMDKKSDGKIARWQKIALEAARQSGRGIVPEVCNVMLFEEAIEEVKRDGFDLALIPWEEEKDKGIKEAIAKVRGEVHGGRRARIAVFVGPEGGFESEECQMAGRQGIVPVTLGPRILRTETAGAAVLAMFIYEMEL